MPSGRKIGKYRHRPASEMRPGPDGVVRHTLVRRRFPFRAVIGLAYGLVGPLLCAGVSWLIRATGTGAHLPRTMANQPAPPAPSLNNVLFGVGLWELIVVWGAVGGLLWRTLWKTRLPPAYDGKGLRVVFPALLGRGLIFGGLYGLLALPLIGAASYMHTGPAEIPWLARPAFGMGAMIAITANWLFTGIIPFVLLSIGLVLGAVTAAAVAVLWRHFPEEPVL